MNDFAVILQIEARIVTWKRRPCTTSRVGSQQQSAGKTNDYVTKPFRFAVLLARTRAQLRQYEASEDAIFTIGPYTFRPSSKLLLNPKGNKVRLTEKETSILRYLYRASQRPVSRETLLQEVCGYN